MALISLGGVNEKNKRRTGGFFLAGLLLLVATGVPTADGLRSEPPTPSSSGTEPQGLLPPPLVYDQSASGTPGYIGATFEGATDRLASTLSFEMRPPQGDPGRDDIYYLLLNAYDDAGRFDQVGLAAYGGAWRPLWGNLANCGGAPISASDYGIDGPALKAGVLYRFQMALAAGKIAFAVSDGANIVWSLDRASNATSFYAQTLVNCGAGPSAVESLTVFEELWTLGEDARPPWGFDFEAISIEGAKVGPWTTWSRGPFPNATGVPEPFSYAPANVTGLVQIWNEWFRLEIDGPLGNGSAPAVRRDFDAIVHGNPLEVAPPSCAFLSCAVALHVGGISAGWSGKVIPQSVTVGNRATVTVEAPQCALPSNGSVNLVAESGAGAPSRASAGVNAGDGRGPVVERPPDVSLGQGVPVVITAVATDESPLDVPGTNFSWRYLDHGSDHLLFGRNATFQIAQAGVVEVTLIVKDCAGNAAPRQLFQLTVEPAKQDLPVEWIGLLVGGITLVAVAIAVARWFRARRGAQGHR